MPAATQPRESSTLAPVGLSERIRELDVIRGFALLGIFLMNIEWFARPSEDLVMGLPPTLHGLDRLAGVLVYLFVQGKFWVMFSMLFGMGFALMRFRAERAGRPFLTLYLRRTAALALFGVLHHIWLYNGDILFGYALAAAGLLLILDGGRVAFLVTALVLGALGFLPHGKPAWALAAMVCALALEAWWLRGERRIAVNRRTFLPLALLLAVLGLLAAGGAGLLFLRPDFLPALRPWVAAFAPASLLLAWLAEAGHEPRDRRLLRLGVTAFVLPIGFLMLTVGIASAPPPRGPARPAGAFKMERGAQALAAAHAAQEAQRIREVAEAEDLNRTETHLIREGGFQAYARFRARRWLETATLTCSFSMLFLASILVGAWLVRSGIMQDPGAHLPVFRRLATVALPAGLLLSVAGFLIRTHHGVGTPWAPFLWSLGIAVLGYLPASLGYLSLVVLALHSRTVLAKVAVLAPAGRMALTNYLMQSAVSALFIHHYGLGHWDLGRAAQLVFVGVVYAFQLLLSTWWLRRFHFGPMEWLWRAATYLEFPPLLRGGERFRS